MRRRLLYLSIGIFLFLSACNLMHKHNNNQDSMLLLVAAWLSSNPCQNQSGLVICIPPGVRL
ncbi:hypothetical protein EHO60_07000 [Leptospira fletcheri]|nr:MULTISPECIES: hypothetical protein [Leptospira]TGK12013.1 hypothetical protein EHO60_07000 [Leptospira fletcheri]